MCDAALKLMTYFESLHVRFIPGVLFLLKAKRVACVHNNNSEGSKVGQIMSEGRRVRSKGRAKAEKRLPGEVVLTSHTVLCSQKCITDRVNQKSFLHSVAKTLPSSYFHTRNW